MMHIIGYIVGIVGVFYLVGSWHFNNRTVQQIADKFYQLELRCDKLWADQIRLENKIIKDCILREENLHMRLSRQEGTTKSLWKAYDELRKGQIALERLVEKLREDG